MTLLLLGLAGVAYGQSDALVKIPSGSPGYASSQQHGPRAESSNSGTRIAALIPSEILEKLHRHANNSHGQPEDAVNLLLLGSEADLKRIFQAAEWQVVSHESGGPRMSRHALQGLSEEAYLARPLSDLYLFGRPQDCSFVHTELVIVTRARHYLRIWRNQSDVNGQELWVGTAAHDIGPWWNSHTGEVGYKIDPHVDRERDLVRDTLNATGLVQDSGYVSFLAKSRRTVAKDPSCRRMAAFW